MADSYAGYVKRPTPINWGAVAGDIVNKMGDVEKEQEAFREKYDTLANDLYNKFGEYEAGKDQQMNQFIYNGIAAGRDVLSALHQKLKRREISPDDFNRATMSMSSEMDKLKTLTDNYDAAIVATIEGINNGKLDNVLSGWALEKFGNLSNLGGKNLQWMPGQDGYTPLYVNEEGKPPTSLDVATNPANLIFNKVDLIEQLKPATGAIGDYKIAIANGKLNDPTSRANYKNFRQELINEILSDSKAVASVLAQYGGYKPYAEGDKVPNKGIKMQISANGKEFDPQVEGLTKTAEGIVGNFIDQMVDYDETKYKVTPSKTTPTYTNEEVLGMQTAWNISVEMANGNFANADNENYQFQPNEDGSVSVISRTKKTKSGKGQTLTTIKAKDVNDARSFAPYTGQFSKNKEIIEWDYINKLMPTPIINPATGTSNFNLDMNDENISSTITSITKENTDKPENLTTVKNEIKKLISSKIPTLSESITFGELKIGSLTNEIPILVNGEMLKDEDGKELTIITDVTVDTGDSKRNKKVIEAAINAAIGSGIDYSTK